MKKLRLKKRIWIAALCLCICLAGGFVLAGCGSDDSDAGYTAEYETITEDFFLLNGDGTYTYGKITVPDTEEEYPLVSISHGIYGSMNSGGIPELSERLAGNGIAAVRVDFNRCLTDDPDKALVGDDSGRTNEYTISNMLESDTLAVNYAIANYNVDKDRLGVYGKSFGGRIAMIMGNESWGGLDYKAMVLIAPAGNEYALIHYFGEDEWEKLRAEAEKKGSARSGKLTLSAQWFKDYYDFDPTKTADKFGEKPVLVYYNTKDTTVEPKTSLDCANSYKNVDVYKVTTDDGHGYEMAMEESKLKEEIMNRVVKFYKKELK